MRALVSAQLLNKFGFCRYCVLAFLKATAYHIKRYRLSTTELQGLLIGTSCMSCMADLVHSIATELLVQRT